MRAPASTGARLLDSDSLKIAPILAAMKRPREVLRPCWRVFKLGGPSGLFTVTGRDSDEALARALKEYADLPEHDRRGLSVQREA
jgi:hypothetical protein